MSIDGRHDIEGLQRIGAIVAEARNTMGARVAAGVTTAELDAIGKEILDRHGARSAPQLAYGFPGATCISVNDDIAHGIPSSERVLCEGDLVNIDVSAELDGYWADTGASFPVGAVSVQSAELLKATRWNVERSVAASESSEIYAGTALAVTSTKIRKCRTRFSRAIECCSRKVG
jgi:methionyl aminopeptidase